MATIRKPEDLEQNKNTSTISGGGNLKVTGYKTTPAQENGQSAINPRITAMQEYLRKTVGGTPTESDLLKNVRNQLMNRTGFSYDHSTDPGFQQYYENAKRSGKMAMQDTMGQAASLTGGYANSWAQTAGQTAYNSYLQDANEMIPEFEQLARARYDAETAALTDKYAILKNEHDEALAEYNSKYDIAREDWYKEQERQTAEKQYEDEKKQREIELLLAMGDYNALDKMGYNTSTLRSQMAADLAVSAAKATVDKEEDDSGLYYYSRKDKDKNGEYSIFHDSNGKEIKVERGLNPYTRTKNPDAEYGTFDNGYQPNHIVFKKTNSNGKTENVPVKLVSTGKETTETGKPQTIWKTTYNEKTQYWLWDGKKNDYDDVTDSYNEIYGK